MKNNVFRGLLILGFVMLYGFTQAQSISGIVSDESGPLPGATIIVKGTTNGTTTDFDGNYTVDANSEAILVVSFVGYVTQEVAVAGKTTINITLVEDSSQLEEVVVVGYTTQTRGDITGSVASVDMKEAMKVPVVNAAEVLQGRVSGVTVVSNGRPGDAPKIVIRGFGTQNNSNPLYIIDGVQTDDSSILSNINPADIDQMNVLKDGAAAIYGARASNGVVIITTKSGGYNMNTSKLSVDMYTGAASVINPPELLNSEQHKDMVFQSLTNAGATITHPQYGAGTFTLPSQILGTKPNGDPLPRMDVAPNGTDWFDEVTQVGKTQNIAVSLENGTETGKYFMSVGFLNRDGVIHSTGYKRGTTRLNSEFKLFDKVRIGEHISASFSRTANPGGNQVSIAMRANPLLPVYDEFGNFAGAYSNSNGLGNTGNPFAALDRSKDNYRRNLNVFGDVYMEVDLVDGLTAKTSFGGSISNKNSRIFTGKTIESPEPQGNKLGESAIEEYSWVWTNTLQYNKSIEDHSFNALIGIESVKNHNKGHGISRSNYLFETPDFYLPTNGGGAPIVDFAYENSPTLYSLFGTASYNYAGKYFATATVRRDKSSRFKGDNRSDIFPSFSAGWDVSKEDFYPQDALVNRLKFKASYGELGNQTLPSDNPTINITEFLEEISYYALDGSTVVQGAAYSEAKNELLRWETSKSINVGVDLSMFDSALNLSFEYFSITTDGLVVRDDNFLPTTGPDATPPLVNKGSINNKGFDFSVGYANKTDSGLGYNISANLSAYKNEVTDWINAFSLGRDTYRNGSMTRTEKGQPLSYFYGKEVIGIFQTQAEVDAAPEQKDKAVGRFIYRDVNGDNVIDDDDRTFIGSPHPDFTYGINLGADYKGFDLTLFFQGSQGNDIYNYNKLFTDFPTFFNNNRSTRVLDAWTPTNTGASLSALSTKVKGDETEPNSYFVEDGSYFRLKNLQIGYTFPEAISKKISMESLRFYLQGTNLLTLTGYSGLDPEVYDPNPDKQNMTLGVDSGLFPISKVISLGVNIKF